MKRLVAVTSWCGKKTPQNPWFFEWIIRPLYIGGALSDIAIMEDYVENTDEGDMNYTIVRPPRLTNGMFVQGVIYSCNTNSFLIG